MGHTTGMAQIERLKCARVRDPWIEPVDCSLPISLQVRDPWTEPMDYVFPAHFPRPGNAARVTKDLYCGCSQDHGRTRKMSVTTLSLHSRIRDQGKISQCVRTELLGPQLMANTWAWPPLYCLKAMCCHSVGTCFPHSLKTSLTDHVPKSRSRHAQEIKTPLAPHTHLTSTAVN